MVPPTSLAWFFVRVRGRSQTSWWTIATTLIRLRVPDNRANPLMPSTVSRVQSDWLPTSVMVPANSPVTPMSSSTSGVEWPIASATNLGRGHDEEDERDHEQEDPERDRSGEDRPGHLRVLLVRAERHVDDGRARPAGLGL